MEISGYNFERELWEDFPLEKVEHFRALKLVQITNANEKTDAVVARCHGKDYVIHQWAHNPLAAHNVCETLNRLLRQLKGIANSEVYLFRKALVKVNKHGWLAFQNRTYAVEPKLAGKKLIILQKEDGTLWVKLEEEDTLYPMLATHTKSSTQNPTS